MGHGIKRLVTSDRRLQVLGHCDFDSGDVAAQLQCFKIRPEILADNKSGDGFSGPEFLQTLICVSL